MTQERRQEYPQLLVTIQQIKDELDMMKDDLHENKENLKKINKILNGNGEVGMVASVIALEKSMEEMKRNQTKWGDRVWDRAFVVAGGVALAWIIFQLGIK